MAALALRNEERIGLGVAIAAHAALVALIVLRPPTRPVIPPPERMTVTLSDEVGLTSAAPDPAADAAPDVAPELGEPAPPEPMVRPEPPPPQPRVAPAPQPRPAPRMMPSPRPTPRATPSPQPRPQPTARPAPRQPNRAQPAPNRQPPRTQPGANRIGSDFLKGAGGTTGRSPTPPAQVTGAVRASLLGSISRAVRPHWQGKVPEGADAEKLVTILRWSLNRDGSLAGPVEFVGQEGQTDANRPQWARHREQAVRAVQLAAPFDLPEQYYDAWKRVGPIRFDKRLAQ